jgi:O-antigen ligase
VVTANLGGYSDRAGVPWNWSERSAPVHNAYYLIAAETGILGLFGYVSLFASVILLGLRALRLKTNSESSELLVGFTASAIVTTVYYAFEWVPMLFQVHYLAATNTGVLIGLAFVVGTKRTMAPIGSSFRRRPAQSPVSV